MVTNTSPRAISGLTSAIAQASGQKYDNFTRSIVGIESLLPLHTSGRVAKMLCQHSQPPAYP
jgi:hypothetical protein